MSSVVVSTSAALGRLFVFDDDTEPEVGSLTSGSRAALDRTAEGGCPHINLQGVQESPLARVQSAIKNQPSRILPARVTPASRLDIRPAPEMVSSGVSALDALTGGLPRGCLTEICGPASSGRTTLLLAAVAAATRRGEFCAVIDASDALDPQSAAATGVELDQLLWVRCGQSSPQKERSPQRHRDTETNSLENQIRIRNENQTEHRLEQVLRATDLLLESGGFGLIVLDLGDLPPQAARHIPLTTWFRFRRAIEYTPTMLLAIEQHPIAGSCSSLLLQLGDPSAADPDNIGPTHTQLFTGLDITAELIQSRLDRKPARSVIFETKTAWAG
jgi:recA bacterial DNA recombination protein